MGRKRSAISLSFSLTNETIESIENMAKNNDLNRSELMRIVITIWLKILMCLKKC